MKRLLILGVILLAACSKIDFEDGNLNQRALEQTEFWRCAARNGVSIYDAEGNHKITTNLNGGFCQEEIVYNFFQIKKNEVVEFYYLYNPKTDTYRKYIWGTSPADFSKRGKYKGCNFIWHDDEIIEGKVTKMTEEEIIIYIDYTDEYRQDDTDYYYHQIVMQKAEPDECFFEVFAEELN